MQLFRLDQKQNFMEMINTTAEIKIYTNSTVSVWRRNGPSFMTKVTKEDPLTIPIDEDIVRIVVT